MSVSIIGPLIDGKPTASDVMFATKDIVMIRVISAAIEGPLVAVYTTAP